MWGWYCTISLKYNQWSGKHLLTHLYKKWSKPFVNIFQIFSNTCSLMRVNGMMAYHPSYSGRCIIQINIGHSGSHLQPCVRPCYNTTKTGWLIISAIYSLDNNWSGVLNYSKWYVVICTTCMTTSTPDSINIMCAILKIYQMRILWHSHI